MRHAWKSVGLGFTFRCTLCGEHDYVGANWCDGMGIVRGTQRIQDRNDCPGGKKGKLEDNEEMVNG